MSKNIYFFLFFMFGLLSFESKAQIDPITIDSAKFQTTPIRFGICNMVYRQPKLNVGYMKVGASPIDSGVVSLYVIRLNSQYQGIAPSNYVWAESVAFPASYNHVFLAAPGNTLNRPIPRVGFHFHLDQATSVIGVHQDRHSDITIHIPYIGPTLNPTHVNLSTDVIPKGYYVSVDTERIVFDTFASSYTLPPTINLRPKANLQGGFEVRLRDLTGIDPTILASAWANYDSLAYNNVLGTAPVTIQIPSNLPDGAYFFHGKSNQLHFVNPFENPPIDTLYYIEGGTDPIFKGNCVTFLDSLSVSHPSKEELFSLQFLCFAHLIDSVQHVQNNRVQNLKKGEWARMLHKAIYITNPNAPHPADNFPTPIINLQSSSSSAPYYRAAKALMALDYKDGVGPFELEDFYFRDQDSISRKDFLRSLLEAWNIKPNWLGYQMQGTNLYDDVTLSHPYYGWIYKAKQLKIIDIGGDFRPDDAITRKEAYILLFRTMASYRTTFFIPRPTITAADFFTPGNYTPETIGQGAGLDNGDLSLGGDAPFSIKTGGMPVGFSYLYSSHNAQIPSLCWKGGSGNSAYNFQTLGKGWEHNYNNRIIEISKPTGTGKVYAVCWAGGSVQLFDGDTSDYITKGVYDSLAVSGNTITIITTDQHTLSFEKANSSDRFFTMRSLTDRFNNKTEVEWTGSEVNKVYTHPNLMLQKPIFTFTHSNGKLDKVKDEILTREVHFTVVNDTLTTYKDAMTGETKYEYGKLDRNKFLPVKIKMAKGNFSTLKWVNGKINEQTQGVLKTKHTWIPSYSATGASATVKIKDAANFETTSHFDALRRMVSSNNPIMSLLVDSFGTVKNILMPTKFTINHINYKAIFDGDGNMTQGKRMSGGLASTEKFDYNSRNDLIWAENALGHKSYLHYNPQGGLNKIESTLGNANGYSTQFNLNVRGQVEQTINEEGITVDQTYQNGLLNKVQMDANTSIKTLFTPDGAGRSDIIEDGNGRKVDIDLNANDVTDKVTNLAMPQNHNFSHNNNNEYTGNTNHLNELNAISRSFQEGFITKDSFCNSITSATYNNDGTFNSTIKRGISKQYAYNSVTKLLEMGPDATYEYTQDGRFNLAAATNTVSHVRTEITYDAFNRPIDVKTLKNGALLSKIGYEYNLNDDVTQIKIYNNTGNAILHTISYNLDFDDRVKEVKWDNTSVARIYYYNDNRLKHIDYPNNMQKKYLYDNTGRLKEVRHFIVNDPTPLVASHRVELDNVGSHQKEYYRIPGVYSSSPFFDTQETDYTPNDCNTLSHYEVRTPSGNTVHNLAYDGTGNITNIGNFSFIRSYNDQLTEVDRGGQVYMTAEFNAFDQRVFRECTVGNNIENTQFTWDMLGMGNVLYEIRNGQRLFYINSPFGLLARVDDNGNFGYFHEDMRGSVLCISDETPETIPCAYQYNAFGEVIWSHEEAAVPYNRFRYVGTLGVQCDDLPNLPMQHQRARPYFPALGIYGEEDPIWNQNLYAYCANNPYDYVDPSGLYTEEQIDKYAKIYGIDRDLIKATLIDEYNNSDFCEDCIASYQNDPSIGEAQMKVSTYIDMADKGYIYIKGWGKKTQEEKQNNARANLANKDKSALLVAARYKMIIDHWKKDELQVDISANTGVLGTLYSIGLEGKSGVNKNPQVGPRGHGILRIYNRLKGRQAHYELTPAVGAGNILNP